MGNSDLEVLPGGGELVLMPQRLDLLPKCTCDGRWGYYMVVDAEGREVARMCLGCAARVLVRQFGGKVQTWSSWEDRPELAEAVLLLKAWRGAVTDGGGWSCLLHADEDVSNLGSGKSHVLQAIGHQWAARGVRVRYLVVPDYLRRLRRAMDTDEIVTEPDEFDGLLILDELASGGVTSWVQEVLERIADRRYRLGYPTLIATNRSLRELEETLPFLLDRLHEGRMLVWSASSWRRR